MEHVDRKRNSVVRRPPRERGLDRRRRFELDRPRGRRRSDRPHHRVQPLRWSQGSRRDRRPPHVHHRWHSPATHRRARRGRRLHVLGHEGLPVLRDLGTGTDRGGSPGHLRLALHPAGAAGRARSDTASVHTTATPRTARPGNMATNRAARPHVHPTGYGPARSRATGWETYSHRESQSGRRAEHSPQ